MLHSITLACQAFLAHHTTKGEVRHICEVTWGQAQPIENPTIHITLWERKAPAFPIFWEGIFGLTHSKPRQPQVLERFKARYVLFELPVNELQEQKNITFTLRI